MFNLPKINYLVYGYANARVHGMKGLLLPKDTYIELSNLKSVDGMVELLQRTHYKKNLLDAAVRYSGSQLIESASGQHYAEIVSKIRKIAPKEDKEIVSALLMKWDVVNLKIVIASKKITSSFSEVKPKIIPAGSLNMDVLESIYNADERDLLSELKKTQFGRELLSQSMISMSSEMWEKFRKAMSTTDQYSQVQAILDTYSYSLMEKYLKPYTNDKDVKAVYKLLREEIATRNIIIIERLKKSGIKDPKKIESYLIAGGLLSKIDREKIMSSEKLEDIFPLVKKYFPKFKSKDVSTLVDLETELTRARSAERMKVFHLSVLSVGTLLGFILLKEEEMNNLRKIARAKEFGIESKEVLETLLIAGA